MNTEEYIEALEYLVANWLTHDSFEWFYYDVLPQLDDKYREAWHRANGLVFEPDEDD
jgi:hypothetical protein